MGPLEITIFKFESVILIVSVNHSTDEMLGVVEVRDRF